MPPLDMDRMILRAEVLLEALPYLQAFQGRTLVIKYGGAAMEKADAGPLRETLRLKLEALGEG